MEATFRILKHQKCLVINLNLTFTILFDKAKIDENEIKNLINKKQGL